MGSGTSKNLARTHGPSGSMCEGSGGAVGGERQKGSNGGVPRLTSSMYPGGAARGTGGAAAPNAGFGHPHATNGRAAMAGSGNRTPSDDGSGNPLGEDDFAPNQPETGNFCYTPLTAILDKPGSTAKYIKKRPIGRGAYGEAYIVERNAAYDPATCPQAEHQVTSNKLARPTRVGGTYVIKVMDLRNMRQQDRQYAQTEIICIAHTNHFAIIGYYEHYILDSGDETMLIVTEFADHGDLSRNLNRFRDARLLANMETNPFEAVVPGSSAGSNVNAAASSASNGGGLAAQGLKPLHLTEKEAGMYFVQILAALHHIHKHRMIHRDVKSANLLLTSNGFIKLGDFGFSQKYESTVSSETIAGTFLGTPYYVSPEMWKGTRYGKKADVWAAGIVLYEMLMDGQRPFEAMGLVDLKRVVLEREVELPEWPPGANNADGGASDDYSATGHGSPSSPVSTSGRRPKFSPDMRELIRSIFQKDPKRRPSTEELLRTSIMQRYTYLFQKHVTSLMEEDDAKRAANPKVSASDLAFPEAADRQLVLKGLQELNELSSPEANVAAFSAGNIPSRYEGVVYKGNRDGSWKERYLALEDDVLIISLSKAKAAVEGAERSRGVPVRLIKAVSPCQTTDPHLQPSDRHRSGGGGAPSAAKQAPYYCFVMFMQESTNPIYFGVTSLEERDCWLAVLMQALNVD